MTGRNSMGGGAKLRLSPVGGGESGQLLSAHDLESRPRRLSAPCAPIPQISPTSPVHRASSPSPSCAKDPPVKMSSDAWVCPNDRQLALRAKLHSGWSVKTATLDQWKQPEPLSNTEQEAIVAVIQRAEELERKEKERLQRLTERLENMKRNAAGDGENTCILCGESFSFFTRQKNLMCQDCKKAVCTKCGVECPVVGKEGLVWLCKICSESREVWKKSGAWFFKAGMPGCGEILDLASSRKGSKDSGDGELQDHKHFVSARSFRDRSFMSYRQSKLDNKDSSLNTSGQGEDEEDTSEDEAGGCGIGSLSKRGLGLRITNNSESDNLSGRFSIPSNYSSMESLNWSEPDRLHRSSTPHIYHNTHNHETASIVSGPPDPSRPIQVQPPHNLPGLIAAHHHPHHPVGGAHHGGAFLHHQQQQHIGGGASQHPQQRKPSLPHLPLPVSAGGCGPNRPPSRGGSPIHFRPRLHPPVPGPHRPPGPPWGGLSPGGGGPAPANHRPPFPSPRGPPPIPRPAGSPRGSPRGMGPRPGGRGCPPRRGGPSRPLSCPPSRIGLNQQDNHKDATPPHASNGSQDGSDLAKESASTSDSDITEVPLSAGPDSKPKARGAGDGVISTLRRLSTVNRKSRSKKKLLELDRDGGSDGKDSKLGSDDSNTPRTPDGSCGVLEFALIYDEINSLLLVNILQAKGLKGLDLNGLCDSYCKVTLVPPIKKVTQQRSKTVHKSVNPEYGSLLHFPEVLRSDLSSLHMHIAILDEDIAGDHLLAEARVGLVKIFPQLQKQFQVCLHKPILQNGESGFIVANESGKIDVSLSFYSQHGTLKVFIGTCRGLASSTESSKSNPYVKVVLNPHSANDGKKKTTVKWNTTDPDFNEQFVFLTNITDLPKQSLTITVWHHDKEKQGEYLGGMILGLNAKGERLHHWADLIKHPNKVHKQTHSLTANFLN